MFVVVSDVGVDIDLSVECTYITIQYDAVERLVKCKCSWGHLTVLVYIVLSQRHLI